MLTRHTNPSNAYRNRLWQPRADAVTAPRSTRDLAAVGRLIGPMIKEIRAPLGNLLAATEMLHEGMPEDDPAGGFVRLMVRESERIDEIVKDISAMVSPADIHSAAVDAVRLMNDVFSAVEPMATRQCIGTHSNVAAASLCVWADADALRTAFDKITRYMMECMPFGGTLSAWATSVETPDTRHACIGFSDTGPTVPDTLLNRIFEPFVVIKGRRSGMGLAISRMTIEQMGGEIMARNNGERGLTLEMQLPLP